MPQAKSNATIMHSIYIYIYIYIYIHVHVYTLDSRVYPVTCTMYTQYTDYTIMYTVPYTDVHCTLYRCTLYSIQMYIVVYTVPYTDVHCTQYWHTIMYIHCTLYLIHIIITIYVELRKP